ncbi:MAG TPA: hypothetical protein VMH86_12085 [Rhizomicrobium sp.]|nr:hypothetical protein [Rhizomicrobium sp.]
MSNGRYWRAYNGENDWNVAANWSPHGVPGPKNHANIVAGDPVAFQVDVTTADVASSLRFDAPAATLFESAGGSLTISDAVFTAGTVVFNGDNNFKSLMIGNVALMFSSASAFGTAAIDIDPSLGEYGPPTGSVFEATADVVLDNAINAKYGTIIAAASGHTLELDGNVTVADNAFIALNGRGAAGTVEIADSWFGGSLVSVTVNGGFVTSGAGSKGDGANELFSDAVRVSLFGTLDVTNFAGISTTLHDLEKTGTVLNTGPSRTLTLQDANYAGTFTGDFKLLVGGTSAFSGSGLDGRKLFMAPGTDHLDLTHATGTFEIVATAESTATAVVAPGAGQIDHFFNFQQGRLTIDADVTARAKVTYADHPTFVTLTIHPGGGQPLEHLYFNGISSHDNFAIGNDGAGHMQIAWSPSEEHAAAVESAAAAAGCVPAVHDGF